MKSFLTEEKTFTLKGWVRFYPQTHTGFYIEKAGYFDERPQINTSVTQLLMLLIFCITIPYTWTAILLLPFILLFGWGGLYINLPIKTGIQDCDSAAWGFNYHDNKIWIYIGGAGNFEGGRKWKTIEMPWNMEWVRTSILMKDGYDWFHETKKNRIIRKGSEIGSYNWIENNKWKETHPFTDKYDGTVLNATISVEEREWRPLWFMWTSLFAKKRKTIAIEFDAEVGSKKGSWKGGTIGCSYELLPNETPLECLKRMEAERDFN